MRRSATIALGLLAAVPLTSCGQDEEAVVPNVSSCVERYGSTATEDCSNAFQTARTQHERTAPRYPDVETCRQQTGGACEILPARTTPDGSLLENVAGLAIPVMGGVLIGRMLQGQGRSAMPVYAGRPPECPPNTPDPRNCQPPQRSGGGGYAGYHYYSGGSYMGQGSALPTARGSAFAPSPVGAANLSGASVAGVRAGGASGSRASAPAVSRGGFGMSASAHGGGGT